MLKLNFKPFPAIETKQLVLKEVTKKDAPALFLLRTNEKAMKYLDKTPPASLDEIRSFIKMINKKTKNNETICWGIFLKDMPELIGTISFHRVDHANYRAEIGYLLMPEHWGKGFISEAIPAIIEYGFSVMKLHSIEANINPDNTVSRKALQKFGFKKEAYFKENYFFNGKFLDSEIYSLLKS